jgi:galactokinase
VTEATRSSGKRGQHSHLPERLRRAAPAGADVAARAPGRANLIGEHTDYNDGFVLPVALELDTWVVGRRTGERVRLRSLDEEGEVALDLGSPEIPREGWGRYAAAVVCALRDHGVEVAGLDAVVASEVPVGAGLSSSAALEVAIALAVAPEPPHPVTLARICRRAENHYVGVRTGIMDQLASAAGAADHALLIDCRDDSIDLVPVPADVAIVVVDSTIRRGLDASGYNERRSQCEQAARALGAASLRDVSREDLDHAGLDDVVARRARHVVSENARVLQAADSLRRGERERLGELFEASHRSLAEDFEVSLPELDALVDAAGATPGVIAARLTGAGFGGCTVNLVDAARAREAAHAIIARYHRAVGKRARCWISRAAAGAASVPLRRRA